MHTSISIGESIIVIGMSFTYRDDQAIVIIHRLNA